MTSGEAFACMDRLLDTARIGPMYLLRADCAGIVEEAIRFHNGRSYELHSYAIMANHAHLLVTPV
jgi:hypothetical protein